MTPTLRRVTDCLASTARCTIALIFTLTDMSPEAFRRDRAASSCSATASVQQARKSWGLAPRFAEMLPNVAFIAPDAPWLHGSRYGSWMRLKPASNGRRWFDLLGRSQEAQIDEIRLATGALERTIDAELDRLALPADRVALVGFSQGAVISLYCGLRRSVAPKAIIAYSGNMRPLRTLWQDVCNRPPVLLVHGDADTVVPASSSDTAATILGDLRVPVDHLKLPGVGHLIDEAGLSAGCGFLRSALLDL